VLKGNARPLEGERRGSSGRVSLSIQGRKRGNRVLFNLQKERAQPAYLPEKKVTGPGKEAFLSKRTCSPISSGGKKSGGGCFSLFLKGLATRYSAMTRKGDMQCEKGLSTQHLCRRGGDNLLFKGFPEFKRDLPSREGQPFFKNDSKNLGRGEKAAAFSTSSWRKKERTGGSLSTEKGRL